MKVSVAMATYNGEKFIKEQVDSILSQLGPNDEIIVSDDRSTDNTIQILKGYNDSRIKIYANKGKGIISNFENAIYYCENDIIFLCDQDDVWLPNKVQVIKDYFKEHKDVNLILSDCYVTDGNLKVTNESFFQIRNSKKGILRNIIKNSYLGCAMVFRKKLKPIILPMPENTPMHDMWIGVLAEMTGNVLLVNDRLFYYRRHDFNATKINKKLDIYKFTKWRKDLVVNLMERKRQIKNLK